MNLRYQVVYETDPPELVLWCSTMHMAKFIATEAAKDRPGVGVSILRALNATRTPQPHPPTGGKPDLRPVS